MGTQVRSPPGICPGSGSAGQAPLRKREGRRLPLLAAHAIAGPAPPLLPGFRTWYPGGGVGGGALEEQGNGADREPLWVRLGAVSVGQSSGDVTLNVRPGTEHLALVAEGEPRGENWGAERRGVAGAWEQGGPQSGRWKAR